MLLFDYDISLLLELVEVLFACNRWLSVELFNQSIDHIVIILLDRSLLLWPASVLAFYQVITVIELLKF